MQLHDFSEMQAFPTKLRYMCICLSEVIFMEGFMRKIYNFINGLEVCTHTRPKTISADDTEIMYVKYAVRVFFTSLTYNIKCSAPSIKYARV